MNRSECFQTMQDVPMYVQLLLSISEDQSLVTTNLEANVLRWIITGMSCINNTMSAVRFRTTPIHFWDCLQWMFHEWYAFDEDDSIFYYFKITFNLCGTVIVPVLEIVILDERSIANIIQNKCLSAGWKFMTTIVLESGDRGLATRMND